jgi:hypothetical protein
MGTTHVGGPLRVGNFFGRNGQADEPGFPLAQLATYRITPAALVANGIAAAQAVAGAGNLTLNGSLVSNGVAVFDVPRAVSVTSSNAGDTTQTATITGTDFWGVAQTETIAFNGAATISGTKAFKTVSRVAISAALAGNGSAGTTDVLGLPYVLTNISDVVSVKWAGVLAQDASTVVIADATSPATATTDDVRGTVDTSSASDGVRILTFTYYIVNPNTRLGLYGVTPA